MTSPNPAIYPGTNAKLTFQFKDLGGALFDPTTVVAKVIRPDASVVTKTFGVDAELVKDSVGAYHMWFTLNMGGKFVYRGEGQGVDMNTVAGEKIIVVKPSAFP